MNAEEAWDRYMGRPSAIAKRDASFQGQLDTMQAQLNELATATQLMTQIANKVLGDGAAAAGDSPPGAAPGGMPGGMPGGAPGGAPGGDPMAALAGAAGGAPGGMPGGAPGGDPMAALAGAAGGGAPPGGDPMAALAGAAGGDTGGGMPGGDDGGNALMDALGGGGEGGEEGGDDFSRIDELLAQMGDEEGGAPGEPVPGEEGMEGAEEEVGGTPEDIQAAFDRFLDSLKYLAHDAVDNGMMDVIDEVAALINSLNSIYRNKILPILEKLGQGDMGEPGAEMGSARDMAGVSPAEGASAPPSGDGMDMMFKSARKPVYYKLRKTIGGEGAMGAGGNVAVTAGAGDAGPSVNTDASVTGASVGGAGDVATQTTASTSNSTSFTESGSGYTCGKEKKRYIKGTRAPSVDCAMSKSAAPAAEDGPASFRSLMKSRAYRRSAGTYERLVKGGGLDVDAANGTVTGWNRDTYDEGDRTTWFSGRLSGDWDFDSGDEERNGFSAGIRNRAIDTLRTRPDDFDDLAGLFGARGDPGAKYSAMMDRINDHVSSGGDPSDTGFALCRMMVDAFDDADALFPDARAAAWDPSLIIYHTLMDAENSWKDSAGKPF